MLFRHSCTVAITCLGLLSAGCGHVEEVRSARLEQATDFNLRAQRAFLRGEYQSAADLYENALRMDVAIENVNGIAINSINLAKVYQVLGKVEPGERLIDRLLEDKALTYATRHLASASVQKALLRLHGNDMAGAAAWADKAAAYCVSDCRQGGVIDNVRAMLALQRKDAAQALHWSERAASANRGESQLEYANSLRLAASARMMLGEHDTALRLLDEALTIDKSLGLPDKIQQDLLLSAQANEQLGRAGQAALFRDRAARILATAVK